MSRNTKILLVIVGALVVICLGSCAVIAVFLPRLMSNTFTPNPANARKIASEIADYTLPADYQEQIGMDLFVEKLVMIARPDQRGMTFTLLQVSTPNVNRDQVVRQMQEAFQQQFQRQSGAMREVAQEPITVRGQETTLVISESETGTNRMRQAVTVFNGKNGLVMVMAMSDTSAWDIELLRSFLASIR